MRSSPRLPRLLFAALLFCPSPGSRAAPRSGEAVTAAGGPLPGQIIVDPEHPQWLRRAGGKHVFICGPGDPEGFLYRGERRPDGTREGDQVALIDKLARHGGNCIYMQVVRSHGGDGERDHNPFVDSDPSRGLDEDILEQWERWFTRMDENGILIYLFFYDDSAHPWGEEGDVVPAAERNFLEEIVRRFKHHRNLIWIVAEESEEVYSSERVRAVAGVIAAADDHAHLVGNHHHSGTTFKAWERESALTHFAMQYNRAGDDAHAGAVEAFRKAAGKYQVIYSEDTEARPDIAHAWACAMGGTMPMLLGMDIAGTPADTLERCRSLQRFFEATDFYTMAPHDELAHAGTKWVLADPGRSAIAYSPRLDGRMGLRDLPDGVYDLLWLDCLRGMTRRIAGLAVEAGDRGFERPPEIGEHCAVWVRRRTARAIRSVFPGKSWERRSPDELGLEGEGLEEFASLARGRGCVVRFGYLVYTWGDATKSADIASASKPIYSHLVFQALGEGRLSGVDEPVVTFRPCLRDLNAKLGYKDRGMTFRHLANQTACLGFTERPGSAYDYNDATMGFFWDTVVNGVYGLSWKEARAKLFGPKLVDVLQFEDPFSFDESGRKAGRPRISPRDFARFGLLYLHGGRWRDVRVIAEEHAVMAVSDPLPLSIPRTKELPAESCGLRTIGGGANQTDHNGGYSWLWWINGIARDGKRWWTDAPEDMFLALGHCGRRGLAVLPTQELIVSWNDSREIHCDRELGNRAFRALRDAVRGAE